MASYNLQSGRMNYHELTNNRFLGLERVLVSVDKSYPTEMLEEDRLKIHYNGYDSCFDELCNCDEVVKMGDGCGGKTWHTSN